jgi:hypothetical protein
MAEQRDERVAMHILVSREARDGLNQFAADMGVSLTALAEVVGRIIHDGGFNPDDWTHLIAEITPSAKQVDAERRRRGEVPIN